MNDKIKKKIVILGSSGFLGTNLHFYFTKETIHFIFYCEKKNVNILNEKELNDYIESINPDIIINCCGVIGSSEMNKHIEEDTIFHNNIILNMNILNCCKKYNIPSLITFSTYRLFGDNITEKYNENDVHSDYNITHNAGYLLSKKILDLQIQLFKKKNVTSVVCFILPNIFGNYDTFVPNGRIVSALISKIHSAKQQNTDLYLDTNSNNKVNLIYAEDVFNIINEYIDSTEDTIKNTKEIILVFNKNGIVTLKQLAEYIKLHIQFNKEIIFSKNEKVNDSIMNPDISLFESVFKNYVFYDIKEKLKETIDHFYISNTGIS